jgi:hypothetical protein
MIALGGGITQRAALELATSQTTIMATNTSAAGR